MVMALLLLAAHCGNRDTDHGDGDPGGCEAACARWAEHGCEQAEPVVDENGEEISCAQFCANVESEGTLSMSPQCIADADIGDAAGDAACAALEEACPG